MRQSTPDLKPGSLIQDTYRIDALLGEGGMGATFRATNLATGHAVAIKVMSASFAANKQAVDLFRRESTHLRAVQHDAVIRYETTLQDREGRLFLVMEFVDGKPLKHYIMRGARLASRDVLALGLRVAQGLAAIHALGIVHRDIAPDNIMIPDDNVRHAKLIDFGLASNTIGTDKSIIGTGFAGKLDYCAPEQFGMFGNKIGPATDRYALGLVLMKVAGVPVPGEGKGMAAIEDRRADIRIMSDRVSPVVRRVLETLLRADPAQRGGDLVQMFQQALAAEDAAAVTPPAGPVAGRDGAGTAAGGASAGKSGGKSGARSGPALALAAGGAVAVAAGIGWWVLVGSKPPISAQVDIARSTLAVADPLADIAALIAAGGSDNLNAALAALIATARDTAKPAADRAQAAVMIAQMYDPATFDAKRSPLPGPNPAAARRYYEQAVGLGSQAAVAALARLAGQTSP